MKVTTPPTSITEPAEQTQQSITALEKSKNDAFLLSPPLLEESQNRGSSVLSSSSLQAASMSSDSDHWVVAYGYTSLTEYHELLDLLTLFGSIQQHHSGGNWLAVQYESRFSAERALCSQPVTLGNSNTLCGTVRGTPSLIQSLWTRSNNKASSSTSISERTSVATPKRTVQRPGGSFTSGRATMIEDNDSKWLNVDGNQIEDRPRIPTTACQKLMSWYFGWEYSQVDDDVDDRGLDHPHSD
jgi:hypothetical protein